MDIDPILFGGLFILVFTWFYLCHRMFAILKKRHPDKYEALGKPSLILNNTISNNLLFIKFLFGRGWRELNDKGASALGNSMLVFFALYTIIFFGIFFVHTKI